METFTGIVQRITYHNPENGWTVLKVSPIANPNEEKTVTVYQSNVFAGATIQFEGEWQGHPKFGDQFKAHNVIEKKPASASALEKYLGVWINQWCRPENSQTYCEIFWQRDD